MARMKVRGLALAVGTLGTLAVGAWASGAFEPQDSPAPPTASEEHALLKKDIGAWDAVIKASMPGPDGKVEEVESRGVETNRLLPGGLWLITDFEGDFGGVPFHGHGTAGYDPHKKKYISTWVDNFSPNMMIMEGEFDEATKTLTSTGEAVDPASGQSLKVKTTVKHDGDDKRVMAMYMAIPGAGDEMIKTLEITYKRRANDGVEPKQ